ncbi:hypothetical protein BDR05DRAFT_953816 [Suillus weaverae]|nr:hypothetical protein BDR05DRAFT_953816 [Suillus weaverae]
MSKHFLSSELRLKIASLYPLGVIQSDISSMDKLTSYTLIDSTNKPLYDTTMKQWPLALPRKGEVIKKIFTFFLNNLTRATVPVEKLHWNTILVVTKLTTTSYTLSIPARKMLDTKIVLTQSHALDMQTKFHLLPLPSPNEFTDEPEAGTTPLVDSSYLKNIDTEVDDVIGEITVNENVYHLLKVIFCNQGLVGCRTICYLAQRDGEKFIIKDYWVKGNKNVVLNEVEMLKALKDIPGVPQCVKHCLVEVELGKVDDTQIYSQKIYNSTQVQKCAVEEHQVLHRDCSLNNSMIEDTEDGS